MKYANSIRFARLYKRLEEGESFSGCIVAFQKMPWQFENVDRGNGLTEQVVVAWRRMLYINLWLIELFFDF